MALVQSDAGRMQDGLAAAPGAGAWRGPPDMGKVMLAATSGIHVRPIRRRRRLAVLWRYAAGTVQRIPRLAGGMAAAILVGMLLYIVTPQEELANRRPDLATACTPVGWRCWLTPVFPPHAWYLLVLDAVYPLLGFILIGEGVVRLAMLMVSRREREQDWMKVMASTHHDHICPLWPRPPGLPRLEQLVAARIRRGRDREGPGEPVSGAAKVAGIPLLMRDMKDDQALVDARDMDRPAAVVVATNADLGNLEVALDFAPHEPEDPRDPPPLDQQIAAKIADAITVDAAFSSAALAAPMVAAMSLKSQILSSYVIAGIAYVTADMTISADSTLAGEDHRPDRSRARLARTGARTAQRAVAQSPPAASTVVREGDRLVVHVRTEQVTAMSAAAQGGDVG